MNTSKLFYATKTLLVAVLMMLPTLSASAQCPIENKAFQSGEFLYYDLHFNWKFVWFKVGTASMSTYKTRYNGQDVYCSNLITRSNKKLDNYFVLRDTLFSYCTEDIVPQYFRKGAHEGDRYYVDEIWYSYPNGLCQLKQHRIEHTGEVKDKVTTYKDCVYDMMSIFLRARNFDASKMKEGDVIAMPVSDAKSLSHSWLKFRGKETFEIEGTEEKFRCLVFSFIEHEDGKNNELLRFYITDDDNHIPVRLDMFLRFGSAKAFLKGYRGVKNPITSRVE